MKSVENRNRFLLITLLALIAITAAYYWYSSHRFTVADKALFRVKQLEEVDQVVLTQQTGEVILKFDGTRWTVNNEQADHNMIDVLFATLQQVQPVRPMAQTQQDSVKQLLQADGVRVRIFSGDDELLSFVAGGNVRKTQAYFQRADDDVYVMAIPGYRVYVSGIFELDKNGWKDKQAFQINWRNFQSLKAEFPNSPADNFNVSFNAGYFSVEELPATDTTRLNDYLDAVSFLTVHSYITNDKLRDSLNSVHPALSISLRDVANREFALSLYPDPRDPAIVTGIINNTQFAWFNRKSLEGILKTRGHFAPK
ncbi:MAG: DUF4340 domain-containing protein [Cyclobacteriaceae bacterium]|nr:DUF4340 domain-containing protein [Cyclobacteriaceae bacterium]